jgi:hypothetical protein
MDDRSIETIVFEALGEASTCWIPPPSDQVFDSTQATAIGEELLAEIRSRIVGDRTDELLAERTRLRTAARDLVLAAKTWCRTIIEDPPHEERERAIHAFAEAVDAFDPMLSETTDG